MQTLFLVFLLVLAVITSSGFYVQDSEWESYKKLFKKSYNSRLEEIKRRSFFSFNNFGVLLHNIRYEQNLESYSLAINQFSDLSVLEFSNMFPPTIGLRSSGVPYIAPTVPPQNSFFYAIQGFASPVQNQGLVCNSGWAYSTATTIQIYDASITGNLNSKPLSAQNLIDCAGGATACSKQDPKTAFDYLTKQSQKLYPQTEYPNNPLGSQGMCVLPTTSTSGKTLKSYSNIADGNDELLKYAVNYAAPVITKLNIGTFQFMHYKQGVFTQPKSTFKAEQFVTVIGYESATDTSKGYWLVQNSFGSTWGEAGMMKIEMNPNKPITNSAVFPFE